MHVIPLSVAWTDGAVLQNCKSFFSVMTTVQPGDGLLLALCECLPERVWDFFSSMVVLAALVLRSLSRTYPPSINLDSFICSSRLSNTLSQTGAELPVRDTFSFLTWVTM